MCGHIWHRNWAGQAYGKRSGLRRGHHRQAIGKQVVGKRSAFFAFATFTVTSQGPWQAANPRRQAGPPSCDLQMRACALCSLAVNEVMVADTTDVEEDGILNDNHWHLCDSGCGDGGNDDDDEDYDDSGFEASDTGGVTGRTNRRWELLERFTDRTEGAVRRSWRMLLIETCINERTHLQVRGIAFT